MLRHGVLLLACTLASCADIGAPSPSSDSQPNAQSWLCGREYENHAWGYQRRGLVFDLSGNVWKYELRAGSGRSVRPWSPNDMSRLRDADLKLRYESAMTTGQKIAAAEIAEHFPLVEIASQATPTTPQMTAADMGQHLTYCYTYDEHSKVYSQVMIDNRGDWTSTNPSSAARKLATWIERVLGKNE